MKDVVKSVLWNSYLFKRTRFAHAASCAAIFMRLEVPDGSLLASVQEASPDVWIWDVNTQTLLQRIPGGGVAFSPDGAVLAVIHEGVTIWECATWRCLEHLPLHPVFIGFSSDGRTLISMEASGRISFWNWATRQAEFAFDPTSDPSRPGWLALSPDDSCLALSTTANQAHLWLFDHTARDAVFLDTVQADVDEGLAFSPDGTLLATLVTRKRSTRVRLYDVQKQEDLGDLDPDDQFLGTERSQPLAFSPGSDYLVAAACNGRLFLWHVNSRRLIASFAAHADPGLRQIGGMRAVAWSRSLNCLATGGWEDGNGEFIIKLWSFQVRLANRGVIPHKSGSL